MLFFKTSSSNFNPTIVLTDTESMNVERRGKGRNKPKHKEDGKKNRLNEGFHSVYPFYRSDDPERSRKIKSSQRELVVECTITTPVSLCPSPPPPNTHTHLPQ